ncbi:hypothetical protein [Streptomyces coeruleorubidus]|uniref:hypothetical protein n=1 Tax=Streptomyces coeruleorubidus TaxID=116188 RepID=UPI00340FDCA7
MSDEVEVPVGASALPVVDEVLAGALVAQGEAGVRALGLLRDARRVLTGEGFVRPAEVAAACVRSAADALLGLPGAPVTVGLKPAAQQLLAAVDAFPAPPAPVVGDAPAAEACPAGEHAAAAGPAGTDGAAQPADGADQDDEPSGHTGPPGTADAAVPGPSRAVLAGWERVRSAVEVLRTELNRPGRYHQARARGIAERLMNVELGAAQEQALDVWGTVYGVASGILHGRTAGPGEAAVLYTDILGAARQLLVPLPGRAARVLELAALKAPGAAEAQELARWSDPRATDYFFRCDPAPAWFTVLAEHAGHLLMPDETAGGRWPAAPFFEHVARADPDAVRAWLSARTGQADAAAVRVQRIAAAGRSALDALLRLATGRWDVVETGQVRLVLDAPGVRDGSGPAVGATLRAAARWARSIPRAERTGEWIRAVQGLLAGAVEDEHAGHLALRAVLQRAAAVGETAGEDVAEETAAAELAAGVVDEEELGELIAQQAAGRLPDHDVAVLVRELACTAYPAGRHHSAHRNVAAIRVVLAKLLARTVELTAEASRPLIFGADLDQVHVGDPAAYGGPRLARAVLDLAAADADAGVDLAARTRHFGRLAAVDAALHGRLLAAHLASRPPADAAAPAGGLGEQEWWQEATALVVQLVAGAPDPEPARLVELVLRTCPPDGAAQLQADVRTALGTAPAAAEVDQVLPAGAEQVNGRVEPLASWLRVWDWSPVLPGAVLAGWEPVLEALRRIAPAGPPDPRAGAVLEPVKTVTALDARELDELAAERGPAAAATALAGAEDAGADGYAMVLHRLVAADPAAWTTDAPAVLEALARPELGAFYLAAAAAHSDRPGAFPDHALPAAVTAALEVRRGLGERTPEAGDDGVHRRPAAVFFADQAVADLLTRVWRTRTALAAGQEAAALAHLYALAAPLTRPAGDVAAGTPDPAGDGTARTLVGSDPEVRALGCLLEYAAHRARTTGEMPRAVLDAVAGALAAHAGQEAVATAVGVHLPHLHRHAPEFAAAHRGALYGLVPGRPSPAASWLRWGGPDRQLLAALDRAELLDALRAQVPGTAGHLAHALLDDPTALGDPAALWATLAAGTGGQDAVGRLLEAIAARTPPAGTDGPLPPAAAARVDAAVVLWRAALGAGLPRGALAGAGAFADAAVAEMVWLELMRASAEHSAGLTDADLVAERAAAHPDRGDALLLAALLVARSAGTWREAAVRRHARALLDAAVALHLAERPFGVTELRTALVNAGDIDAAGP